MRGLFFVDFFLKLLLEESRNLKPPPYREDCQADQRINNRLTV